MEKLLRIQKVMERTDFVKSTIHLFVKEKRFPQPIALSARVNVWKESEIKRFIDDPAGYPEYLAELEKSENTAIKTA